MKTAQNYLEEANAVVPKLSFEEAKAKHDSGTLFIDVRDSADIKETGTVKGATRINRGMIEFAADPDTPFYNDALKKDAEIVTICGKGGQAALAGKTLKDMGYQKVYNAGGVPDWKENGGAMEDG